MKEIKVKYCSTCKHYREHRRCGAPQLPVNLVSGKPSEVFCSIERANSRFLGLLLKEWRLPCGKKGRYYEPA